MNLMNEARKDEKLGKCSAAEFHPIPFPLFVDEAWPGISWRKMRSRKPKSLLLDTFLARQCTLRQEALLSMLNSREAILTGCLPISQV